MWCPRVDYVEITSRTRPMSDFCSGAPGLAPEHLHLPHEAAGVEENRADAPGLQRFTLVLHTGHTSPTRQRGGPWPAPVPWPAPGAHPPPKGRVRRPLSPRWRVGLV
jgi:hypothetical protein